MQRPARSLSLSLVSLDAARFDGEKQIEQRRERRNVEERKDFDNVEIRYYFHDVEIAATYFFSLLLPFGNGEEKFIRD